VMGKIRSTCGGDEKYMQNFSWKT